MAKGGFPAAGRPDQGNGSAGRDDDVDILQDLFIPVIGKADMIKLDIPMNIFQLFCIRRIDDVGLNLHNLTESLHTSHPRFKLLHKVCQPADGLQKYPHIHNKRQKVRRFHLPLINKIPADSDDDHIQHIGKVLDSGFKNCHVLIRNIF